MGTNEKEGLGTDKLRKYQADGMWKTALENVDKHAKGPGDAHPGLNCDPDGT